MPGLFDDLLDVAPTPTPTPTPVTPPVTTPPPSETPPTVGLFDDIDPLPEDQAADAITEAMMRATLRKQGALKRVDLGHEVHLEDSITDRDIYDSEGIYQLAMKGIVNPAMSPEEIRARVKVVMGGRDPRASPGLILSALGGLSSGTMRLFGQPEQAERISDAIQSTHAAPDILERGFHGAGASLPAMLATALALRSGVNPAIAASGVGPRTADVLQRGALATLMGGESIREDIQSNPAGFFNSPGHTLARGAIEGLTEAALPGGKEAVMAGRAVKHGLLGAGGEIGADVFQEAITNALQQYISRSQQASETGVPLEHNAELAKDIGGAAGEAVLPSILLSGGALATNAVGEQLQDRGDIRTLAQQFAAEQDRKQALEDYRAGLNPLPGRTPESVAAETQGLPPTQITAESIAAGLAPRGADLSLEAERLAEAEAIPAQEPGLLTPEQIAATNAARPAQIQAERADAAAVKTMTAGPAEAERVDAQRALDAYRTAATPEEANAALDIATAKIEALKAKAGLPKPEAAPESAIMEPFKAPTPAEIAGMPPSERAKAINALPMAERPAMISQVIEAGRQRRLAPAPVAAPAAPVEATPAPEVEQARIAAQERSAALAAEEMPAPEPGEPSHVTQAKAVVHAYQAGKTAGRAPAQQKASSAATAAPTAPSSSTGQAPGVPATGAAPVREGVAPGAAQVPTGGAESVSAPPRLTSANLRSQIERLPIAKKQPKLVNAAMALIEARANAVGKSADEWIGDKLAGVEAVQAPGRVPRGTLAESGKAGEPEHGAVRFLKDTRAIINVFETANESTIFHELFHVFRRDLSTADEAILAKWAGAKPKEGGGFNWTRGAEEKVARGGERYLYDGKAPVPGLSGIFQQFAQWMRGVYKTLSGSGIDLKITPQAKAVYDRLFSDTKGSQRQEFVTKAQLPGNTDLRELAVQAEEGRKRTLTPAEAETPTPTVGQPVLPETVTPPTEGTPDAERTRERPVQSDLQERKAPVEKAQEQARGAGPTGGGGNLQGEAVRKAHSPEAVDQKNAMLANPGATPAVRKTVAEARAKMGPPEVEHWEETYAAAEKAIADPQERERIADKVKRGEILDSTETAAYDLMLNSEATTKALESGDPKALKSIIDGVTGYTAGGTELGRAMSIRRDKYLPPEERIRHAVTRALTTPSTKELATVAKLKEKQRTASPASKVNIQRQIDRVTKKHVDRLQRWKRRMAGLGIDTNDLGLLYQDAGKAAMAVDEMRIDKGDYWDAQYEWWINSILSGFRTHEANIIGNAANMGLHFMWEKPLQVAISKALPDSQSGPTATELGHVYKALFAPESWRFAWDHLMTSWRSERPVIEAEVEAGRRLTAEDLKLEGAGAGGKFETSHAPQIRGKIGTALRSVATRPMQAVDQFFKSLGARAEVAGEAYRRGKEIGFADGSPELEAFMNAEVADMSSQSWQAALETGRKLTFSQDVGPITQKIKEIRNVIPGGRYVVPFIPIVANLMGRGLKMAPLTAQVNMAIRMVRQGLYYRSPTMAGALPYTRNEVVADAASSVLGLMLLAWFMGTTDDDETGAPFITGTRGAFDPRKAEAERQVSPKTSIKIGGQWYDYSRISPMDVPMAVAADLAESVRHGNQDMDSVKKAASTLGALAFDKSFMQNIADSVKMLNTEEASANLPARLGRGILSGFVPNILRQFPVAAQDETKAQTPMARSSVSNPAWWSEQSRLLAGQAVAGLPFVPKVDKWGREISKDAPTTAGDFLWRLVLPSNVVNADPVKYDVALFNWNRSSEKPEYPSYPRNYIEPEKAGPGETRGRWYYSPEQYNDMLRERGAKAREILSTWERSGVWSLKDPVHPTSKDIDRIKQAFSAAGEQVLKKWKKIASESKERQ